MKDFKGDFVAEDIVVINSKKIERSDNTRSDKPSNGNVKIITLRKQEKIDTSKVGKTYVGKVKLIKNFGIFISLPEMKDGLIHKNSNSLPEKFLDIYSIDDNIEVEVIEETPKRFSLRQIK